MLTGRCHCGNIAVRFETREDPRALPLRECDCSFCRRHGARTTADPRGRVEISVEDPAELSRYRWGLATADFLVCRRCGVYCAAVLSEGGEAWATINTLIFDDRAPFLREAATVSYDAESAPQRIARRKQSWTPASGP